MTVEQLTAIFQIANNAAIEAQPGEDSGTCNLDSVHVSFGRTVPRRIIEEAASSAGIRIYSFGRGYYSLGVSRGMGSQRTRMAEAACRSLKESGLDARVIYRMD